ncbi:unnamed protein product [Bursaphelenchus xylophilus]|uniref:non-specific serine/threonine protein kinase n=1 Tax=Bursaphelenchus xylophilus TaxID=6326 RepID=A0A1I7SU35_BURXY|nr:unnamed protein product [Bursaphelenchus xylophilus]CAG9107617.1 unnamed protein product [Bursaphelenchus xylophilus]
MSEEDVLLTVSQKKSLADFYVHRELGSGSYSNVYYATAKSDGKKYALKVCDKHRILREKKTKAVFREKDALMQLSTAEKRRPFIVMLYCTFQDESSLYFVLSYAEHRDLAEKMLKQKTLDLETTKFIISELVTAIAYCHSNGILHRDIKPGNMLIKEDFHMMLGDFGECITIAENEKVISSDAKRKCSFVGSHLYVSPEVLRGQGVDETCDYFAVGSILFEFVTGKAPYHDLSEHLVFQRIIKNLFSFPDDFPCPKAKSAVLEFLEPKKENRLGSKAKNGFDGIKNHCFFEGVDWENLFNLKSPLAKYYSKTEATREEVECDDLLKNF